MNHQPNDERHATFYEVDERIVEQALLDIYAHMNSKRQIGDPGLLAGNAGRLLFCWYLAKRFPEAVDPEFFDWLTESICQATTEGAISWNFANGLSGIGAALELIQQEQSENYDGDFNRNTDIAIQNALNAGSYNSEIEIVQGLVGPAIYATRRARKNEALPLLQTVLTLLERHSTELTLEHRTWSTPKTSPYWSGKSTPPAMPEYNLGIAHGVPGVISALIPALNHDHPKGLARDMLQGAIAWLLDQQQDPSNFSSHFGYYSGLNTKSRLGWCYGDLGISIALARAGSAIDSPHISEAAFRYAASAARRCSRDDAQVRDAGLCHGSSGLAVMFHLLHQRIGGTHLHEAGQFWLNDLVTGYARHGLSAFNCRKSTASAKSSLYVEEQGLLEGYAGIGLVLLACIGVEPTWADLLLLG